MQSPDLWHVVSAAVGAAAAKLIDFARANTGRLWQTVGRLEAEVAKLRKDLDAVREQNNALRIENLRMRVEVNELLNNQGLPDRYVIVPGEDKPKA